jgi:hypothetical protein
MHGAMLHSSNTNCIETNFVDLKVDDMSTEFTKNEENKY